MRQKNIIGNNELLKRYKIYLSSIIIVMSILILYLLNVKFNNDCYIKLQNNENLIVSNKLFGVYFKQGVVDVIKLKKAQIEIKQGNIGMVITSDNIDRYNYCNGISYSQWNLYVKNRIVSINLYGELEKIYRINIYGINKLLRKENLKNVSLYNDKFFQRILVDNDVVSFDVQHNRENTIPNYLISYVPLEKIAVMQENINLKKGTNKELKIYFEPFDASNIVPDYDFENEKIAQIKDGDIYGKTVGTTDAYISVEGENVASTFNISVIPVVEQIKLDKESVQMYEGSSTRITATVIPEEAVNKQLKWTSSNESVAKVENETITAISAGSCDITVETVEEPSVSTAIKVNVNKKNISSYATYKGNSVKDLTYINGILIANKQYGLPADYAPGINSEAYNAYLLLKEDARNSGHYIPFLSGYRSYNTQYSLYYSYVNQYGQASADTFSARPGYSEHQTGLAFDVGSITDSYGDTQAGIWLKNNAHRFGFIIRYPEGKQHITGYKYEPWHIRYLGIDVATAVYKSGLCLEEYLGI